MNKLSSARSEWTLHEKVEETHLVEEVCYVYCRCGIHPRDEPDLMVDIFYTLQDSPSGALCGVPRLPAACRRTLYENAPLDGVPPVSQCTFSLVRG